MFTKQAVVLHRPSSVSHLEGLDNTLLSREEQAKSKLILTKLTARSRCYSVCMPGLEKTTRTRKTLHNQLLELLETVSMQAGS